MSIFEPFHASLHPDTAEHRVAYYRSRLEVLQAEDDLREVRGQGRWSFCSPEHAYQRLVSAQLEFAKAQVTALEAQAGSTLPSHSRPSPYAREAAFATTPVVDETAHPATHADAAPPSGPEAPPVSPTPAPDARALGAIGVGLNMRSIRLSCLDHAINLAGRADNAVYLSTHQHAATPAGDIIAIAALLTDFVLSGQLSVGGSD